MFRVAPYRQVGVYAGLILKGGRPTCPFCSPLRSSLSSISTRQGALGLAVPPTLLRARRRGDRVNRREFITLLGGASAITGKFCTADFGALPM